jgi:hypothetical protein
MGGVFLKILKNLELKPKGETGNEEICGYTIYPVFRVNSGNVQYPSSSGRRKKTDLRAAP